VAKFYIPGGLERFINSINAECADQSLDKLVLTAEAVRSFEQRSDIVSIFQNCESLLEQCHLIDIVDS
jgi:hypothetical protein